jgi:hypothetical protein
MGIPHSFGYPTFSDTLPDILHGLGIEVEVIGIGPHDPR